MIAFASSLDQAGVFARSAADAAIVLKVMAGFDPKDSTSIDAPVPDYPATLGQPLTGLKIGLLREFFEGLGSAQCGVDSRGAQRSIAASARKRRKSACRTCRCRSTHVLRGRAGRVLVEFIALRRRAFRVIAASSRRTCSIFIRDRAARVSAPR